MASTPPSNNLYWPEIMKYRNKEYVLNKIKIEGGLKIPMSEIITNNLIRKINKIKKDREILIKKITKMLKDSPILLCNSYIKKDFRMWLIKNDFFMPYKKMNKKRKRFRKYTNEYTILHNLYFYYDNVRFEMRDYDKCPYTNKRHVDVSKTDGETWLKYELILNKIIKAIPQYLESFYKKELLRLCDKKFTHVCEKCGTKNEKCAVYCNICGVKLNG